MSLLSPTAFTLGADVLLNYEGVNVGLTWGGIEDDSFSLFRVLLLMLFDTCLYGWLAWYLEHVLPSQYSPSATALHPHATVRTVQSTTATLSLTHCAICKRVLVNRSRSTSACCRPSG